MEIQKESCSVCWRDFCQALKPFTLLCGHSYCSDCSQGLRHCPLCRKRVPTNMPKITNYSLLSLIEKNEQIKAPEQISMAVQTDPPQIVLEESRNRPVNMRHNYTPNNAKKSAQSLRFKFKRNDKGNLEGIEVFLN